MLRTDGKFEIYLIQHQQSDGKWVGSNLDRFGTPYVHGLSIDPRTPDARIFSRYTYNGFSANGCCWQQTGVHGTFDKAAALEALQWMTEKHKGYRFRIVCRMFEQTTNVVAEMILAPA